jgi:hypothetical protein
MLYVVDRNVFMRLMTVYQYCHLNLLSVNSCSFSLKLINVSVTDAPQTHHSRTTDATPNPHLTYVNIPTAIHSGSVVLKATVADQGIDKYYLPIHRTFYAYHVGNVRRNLSQNVHKRSKQIKRKHWKREMCINRECFFYPVQTE